jgi:hypothetical protein
MWQFIVGVVLGWFAHLHYGEQIIDTVNEVIGKLQ